MGADADAVGRETVRRRLAGERVAGFVGSEETLATAMGEEMLGGLDELVALAGDGPGAPVPRAADACALPDGRSG